jgi:competence protein ComEA
LGGAAKWAAVGVLGALSAGGLAWTVWSRPVAVTAEPRAIVQPATRQGVAHVTLKEDAEAPGDGAASTVSVATLTKRINLNSATQAELELLPGVGPALASRIIVHRTEHGAFASVDRLDDVKGIGPAKLAKIRPLVCVDDAR